MTGLYASDAELRAVEVASVGDARRGQPISAVIIGSAIALATGAALTALGTAIGAGSIDAVARDTPQASTFAMAGGAWVMASHLIAVGLGAYAAGRIATVGTPDRAGFHGLGVWAFTILLTLSVVGGAVARLGSAASGVVGSAAQTVAAGAGAAVGGTASQADPQAAIDRVRAALSAPEDPARMTSDQRAAATAEILGRSLSTGSFTEQDCGRATALVAAEAGITEAEARARIDAYEAKARRTAAAAEQRARSGGRDREGHADGGDLVLRDHARRRAGGVLRRSRRRVAAGVAPSDVTRRRGRAAPTPQHGAEQPPRRVAPFPGRADQVPSPASASGPSRRASHTVRPPHRASSTT
jgi:hypothetical protein